MARILISQSNLIETPGVVLASADVVATLPLANLATRDPSEATRWSSTAFTVTVDLLKDRAVSLVVLQAHSISRTGEWRVRMGRTTSTATGDGEPDTDEAGMSILDDADLTITDEEPVTPAGTTLDVLYDSGWMPVWDRVATWSSRPWGAFPWDGREAVAGGDNAILVLAASEFIRYLAIDVRDPDTTASVIDIGRLLVDAPFRPSRNLQVGYTIAVIDESAVETSRGGQPWLDRRPPLREIAFSIAGLRKAEMLPAALDRALAEGRAVPILVVVDHEDLAHRHRETVYGLARELSPPVNARLHWSKSWTIREWPQ